MKILDLHHTAIYDPNLKQYVWAEDFRERYKYYKFHSINKLYGLLSLENQTLYYANFSPPHTELLIVQASRVPDGIGLDLYNSPEFLRGVEKMIADKGITFQMRQWK